MINIKKVFYVYVVLSLIWAYLLLVAFIQGNTITHTLSYVYLLVDIFPISIVLVTIFVKKKYDLYDVINIVLISGSVQAITSVLAFFFPSVKMFFITQLLSYGYSDTFIRLADFRMFGYSSNLTFSTPIVQSFLASVSLFLSINKNIKYVLFAPLLIFSAIINARIAIIFLVVGILLALILKKNNVKVFFRFIIISVMLMMISIMAASLLKNESTETYSWIAVGLEEMNSFFKTDSSNDTYLNYFTDENTYELPENFSLLFGVGERILGYNSYKVNSDVGYINDVWLGGILYSLLIYLIIIYTLVQTFKRKEKIHTFLFYLFLFTFFIANIKGYIFAMNNFTSLFIVFFTFLALRKKV